MLDDTGTLQQATLVGLTLEVMAETTLDDALQVARQLTHLTRSEEYVGCAVVIEEQRGVMEVAQTGVDSPRALGLRGGEDVGLAHRTALVGG